MWRSPSEPCLLARRRRLQPYSASGAVWVSILTTSCLLSSLSDRFCKEKLRMNRFAKRGNTIQLRLGVRLCLFRGRRMGDILRMAFTQNRVRSYTGASLSLTVCLLSYGPPPSISLTQPFTHHSISCDPYTIANRRHQTFSTFRGPNRFTTSFEVGSL